MSDRYFVIGDKDITDNLPGMIWHRLPLGVWRIYGDYGVQSCRWIAGYRYHLSSRLGRRANTAQDILDRYSKVAYGE